MLLIAGVLLVKAAMLRSVVMKVAVEAHATAI
jgi:hypothetical protein